MGEPSTIVTEPEGKNGHLFSDTAPLNAPAVGKNVSPAEAERAFDAYTLVNEAMLTLLTEPRVDKWLANKMGVRPPQMKDWLDRGVREGRIVKLRLKKRILYAAHTPTLFA
jgi:hypothetical protein